MRVLLRSILKRTNSATVLGLAAILFLATCSQEQLTPRNPSLAIGVDSVSGASIQTNQDDYVPGEVVHLVLKGWAANEDVRLLMTEDPDTHGDVDTTVTVDENGEWSGHFYDVQEHDLGVVFTLTGTGSVSGSSVTVVFTDNRVITLVEIKDPTSLSWVTSPGTITVSSGTLLTARVTGNTDAGGQGPAANRDDWESTKWEIRDTPPGNGVRASGCDDGINVTSAGTGHVHTFQMNDTAAAGTYRVVFTAYRSNGCSDNPSSDVTWTTLTNTAAPVTGTIELKKTWVGAGGQTTLKIGTSIGGSETKLQVTGAAGAAPLTTSPQTVTPGTYYVSETGGLTGYTSTLACTKNGSSYTPLANNGAAVAAGDVVVCTFTNSQKPQIKVIKQVVPDGGAGKFDITVAGTLLDNSGSGYGDGEETGFVSVDPGTVAISEAGHTGTTLSNYSSELACNSGKTVGSNLGTSGTVELAFGDVVTCTFTNSRKPQLKVVKETAPTNDTGKFDFTIDGTLYNNTNVGYGNGQGTDFINFTPGTISFSEAAHTGTTGSNYNSELSCDSGKTVGSNAGTSGTVTLAYGDVVTCTFKNSRKPQIKVAKATVPTGDGGKFDFTIAGNLDNNSGSGYGNGGATAFVTVATGDIAISEAGHSGTTLTEYHSELACDNGKTVAPNGGTSGTVKGLAYGDVITCTFTNSRKPQLKVKKATVPAGDGGTFDFTIGGTGHNNSGAGYGNGQGTDFITFDAGNVSFSETGHGTTSLSNYTAELACDNEKDADPNGGSSGTVNLAYGDVITCTFTNTRNATLDIEKISVGGVGAFDFVGTGVTASFTRTTTSIGVATTSTPFVIAKANFTGAKYVQEDPPAAWEITDIDCTANGASYVIGRGGSGSFTTGGSNEFDPGDNTVKVTVDAGDNPACTFENTKAASLDIEKISKDDLGTFNFDATGLDDFTRTTTAVDVATTNDPFTIGVANFGMKYVEETVPTGWVVTKIECTEVGATIRIGRGSGLSFTDGGGNGFNPGDNSVEVDIGSGDAPVCTFTNRKNPTLTITKATVPATDVGKFDFTVAGTLHDNSGGGYGNSASTGSIILDPGQISFSEAGHGTVALADYVSVLECSKTLDDNSNVSGKVTLGYGENVSCTFTNKKKPKLKVAKATVPTTDPGKFDFTIDGVSYDNTTAGYGNGQATDFIKFDQGNVNIGESAHTGTTLSQYESALACNYGKVPSSNTGTAGTVALVYGDVITCTFTNTKKGSIELKKVWKGEGGQTTLRIGTAQNGYQVDQQQTGANGNTPLTTDANFVSTAITTYYVSETGGLTKFSPSVACTNKGNAITVNSTTGAVTVNPNDEVVCTFTNTRIPDLTVTASPSPQQYSDKVELKAALSPTGPVGTVYFYVNGSVDCSTVNTSTAVGSAAVASDEAKVNYAIAKPEGSYTVTACFDSGDLNFADGSGTGSLTVTPEDASVSPDASNVYSYPWAGVPLGEIKLRFNLFEKGTTELNKNTAANWAAGDINNEPLAKISAVLTPLNGGGAPAVTCSDISNAGAGYNKNRLIECKFTGLGLDIYELALKIGTDSPTTDDFYAGTYEVIVAVSDPNAKLPSGGGFIQLDDSFGESRLNFGFNYSSQGGKASKTIKGGMVAIRHFTSGSFAGWVCRVKTNSLSAPTQTAPIGSTNYWYSSFSGSNVSYNCKDALGVLQETQGNQTLAAYVEDNGEPGRTDTFWLKVFGKINMPLSAVANDVTLTGGNIQVPKPVP